MGADTSAAEPSHECQAPSGLAGTSGMWALDQPLLPRYRLPGPNPPRQTENVLAALHPVAIIPGHWQVLLLLCPSLHLDPPSLPPLHP